MAVLKCKMCGGELSFEEGATVCECEYCGSKQTIPNVDDEKRVKLYERANRLRLNNEFDKAYGVYESIIADSSEEAEAYWGLVLCKYGIEYVDDPATGEKVPTCHRSSFDSVMDDANFEMVMENADSVARSVYREQAKAIEEIRKGIIEVSSKEEPYDIFICYKETDENGDRTVDSLIAQDTYDALTEKGYKVFFSRITLEDKLGQEYEPYIFAALNSAKVMLVFGTDYEYFNAVWVKNEWSRYLQLMAKGAKKTLIPCYKGLDAYDIPKEFAKLQAQDMGKVGALQDLLRGIEKIIPLAKAPVASEIRPVVTANTATVDSLLKRVSIFLNDAEWKSAEEYCEKVLDIDPENAQAYLGELMAALRAPKKSDLKNCRQPFDTHRNYEKVLRYGDAALASELKGYISHINARNKEEQQSKAYNKALQMMQSAKTEDEHKAAAGAFNGILDYKDATELKQTCLERAECTRKDNILKNAKSKMSENSKSACEYAIGLLESIHGWKDADDLINKSRLKVDEIKAKEAEASRQAELERLEKERQAELERAELARKAELERIENEKRAKKKKKIAIIISSVVCAAIAILMVLNTVIIPNGKYNDAVQLMNDGELVEAYETFIALNGYKDSAEKADSISSEYKKEKMKTAKAGDYITFGAYEQEYGSEGQEEIEWLVLEVKDGRALLISKYVLHGQAYTSGTPDHITWESCNLRKWLNDGFINSAFTEEEQAMIPEVEVFVDESFDEITDPGKATKDQIFILSLTEMIRYFDSPSAVQCRPTEFAEVQGAEADDNGFCYYHLRTVFYGNECLRMTAEGELLCDYQTWRQAGVRPALWIDLDE